MTIRVLIADDHSLFASALSALLQHERWAYDFAVVDETHGSRDTVARVRELRPDVVIMDFMAPRGNGLKIARAIRQASATTKVFILSDRGTVRLFRAAARAGAMGYLRKTVDLEDLVAAIRAVHRGSTVIAFDIAHQRALDAMWRAVPPRKPGKMGLWDLTERELQILTALIKGLSNKEIGLTFLLSTSTVRSHLRSIYRKLHVRKRAEASAFAITHSLADRNEELESSAFNTFRHAGRLSPFAGA